MAMIIINGCDRFENRFYTKIDQGQINAIKNGSDTFDLSIITEFEWDSVLLIRGNESVPYLKEEIEEILNNRSKTVHLGDNHFLNPSSINNTYTTTDLQTNRDRFYFLTLDKKIIEKEINSGIHKHKPAFDIISCFADSIQERYWLSKNECKFILKSNSLTAKQGTVFLYPDCKTKYTPDNIFTSE